MQNNRPFPQVLLLGNGVNRAYGGNDWTKLIKTMKSNPKVRFDDIKEIPFPLQVILATGNNVDISIKNNQKLFYGTVEIEAVKHPLRRLLEIGFDHILTTNYSYEIERSAGACTQIDGSDCVKCMGHTRAVKRAESKYLLHTYNEVNYNDKTCKIWHIHGEARKRSSIVIGHYNYGKLIAKYYEELEKRKNTLYERQKDGRPIIIDSWLDAFILGDVHVLGFGFDMSEIDLWWLLHRKQQEKAEHGMVYFYEPGGGDPIKLSLLDVYDVSVNNLCYLSEPEDYRQFYDTAIMNIYKALNSI